MPVDRESGIRLVGLQDRFDCGFRRIQRRKRPLLKSRRKARSQKKRILVPKRNLEISARRAIISRLGSALPVSRHDRCRVELSAA